MHQGCRQRGKEGIGKFASKVVPAVDGLQIGQRILVFSEEIMQFGLCTEETN